MSARSFTRGSRLLAAAAIALAIAACKTSEDAAPPQPETTVAAAISLRNVLPTLIERYGKDKNVTVTYGASGDLRKQVEGGAPIDIVVLASKKPVDQLIEKGLVDGESVRLATNTLVLIAPATKKTDLTWKTLTKIPKGEHLAIGDPGAVPAGDYAKQALTKLGIWEEMQDRIVLAGDVGAVLTYARRGEAAAAIVYKTEAAHLTDVVILEEASGDFAPIAEVMGAATKSGSNLEGGRAFLRWLQSPEAQKILAETGFGPP